jgi:aminotransferase EvaB
MEKINVWGYLKEYEATKEELLKAVTEVFESGTLILGQKGRDFEQAYSDYIGVKYGVGCDNGTNAITLALRALGISDGDEVITVSNTAIPTVSAIVTAGATPVFVDIDPNTYLMDVTKVEAAITPRTKAILPVHLYGQCVDMDPLLDIAREHRLFVIEDCAQSHGAIYKGRKAGSMGDISTTSFYPTKILGAYGDGGMINTNDEEIAKRLRRLRFYGAEKTYYAMEHGYNSRLDEMQAAILLTKLPKIEQYVSRRREIAAMYQERLAGSGLILPEEASYGRHAYYLYVVRHPNRDEIIRRLHENNIHVNISYPWPIHTMKAYEYLGWKAGDLPETEAAAKEIFSLPMYPSLTDQEVHRFIKALIACL